jgi:hypothetical protein
MPSLYAAQTNKQTTTTTLDNTMPDNANTVLNARPLAASAAAARAAALKANNKMTKANNSFMPTAAREAAPRGVVKKTKTLAAFAPLISSVPRLSYHPKAVALVKALAITLPCFCP